MCTENNANVCASPQRGDKRIREIVCERGAVRLAPQSHLGQHEHETITHLSHARGGPTTLRKLKPQKNTLYLSGAMSETRPSRPQRANCTQLTLHYLRHTHHSHTQTKQQNIIY